MKPTMPMNAYPPGGPPGTPPPGGHGAPPGGGGWGPPGGPPQGYPPQGYPPQGGYAAPAPKKDNTMLYVGIGCGCLSIFACLLLVPLGWFLVEQRSAPELRAVNEVAQGELSDADLREPNDNSPYDDYRIEAGVGWTITADMQSAAFDTYLALIGPRGVPLVQDDDGGEGLNSRLRYVTTEEGTYTVRANSYSASGRGPYTLRYTATPP